MCCNFQGVMNLHPKVPYTTPLRSLPLTRHDLLVFDVPLSHTYLDYISFATAPSNIPIDLYPSLHTTGYRLAIKKTPLNHCALSSITKAILNPVYKMYFNPKCLVGSLNSLNKLTLLILSRPYMP